jgi:membrane protein implicated in regulation of membrane protease activity
MMEALTILRQMLELGFPAVVLVQLWLLWRAYEKRVNEHIRELRSAIERYQTRRGIVVCEDVEQPLIQAHDDKHIARA